jgi:hypothetical protein
MYNPDKMYEVPSISQQYCEKQDFLNASLRKRYGVDLTTYSMRTPSPFKPPPAFKSPYANHNADFGKALKFPSQESERVQKDDLVETSMRTSTKSIHAVQSARGIATVETFGGREAPRTIPEESVKTWDATTTITAVPTPASTAQGFEYILPGHEQQQAPEAPLAQSAGKTQASVLASRQEQQQDRTKTILTLMGTIKLLESKNAELLKARNHADAELHQVSLPTAMAGCLNHARVSEQSLTILCVHAIVAGALKKCGPFCYCVGPAAPAASQG